MNFLKAYTVKNGLLKRQSLLKLHYVKITMCCYYNRTLSILHGRCCNYMRTFVNMTKVCYYNNGMLVYHIIVTLTVNTVITTKQLIVVLT